MKLDNPFSSYFCGFLAKGESADAPSSSVHSAIGFHTLKHNSSTALFRNLAQVLLMEMSNLLFITWRAMSEHGCSLGVHTTRISLGTAHGNAHTVELFTCISSWEDEVKTVHFLRAPRSGMTPPHFRTSTKEGNQ